MSGLTKILMIDDDPALCGLVKVKLEKTGKYDVAFSDRGSQVLQLVRKEQPALIILDIEMPDMPGSEVAALLKDDLATSSIPVLFLSSIVRPEDVEAAGGVIGGRQMASKKTTVSALIQRIEQLL